MADNACGGVFVFIEELLGAGERYLVDIAVDILGGHAYAGVADSERAGLFVDSHTHIELTDLAFEFAERREGAQLLAGVDGVRDKLTEENLVVAIEKFFDDGENIFGRYPDSTFLHIVVNLFIQLQV